MKLINLILFLVIIHFSSFGQIEYENDNLSSKYIFSFKEKIDSLIENGDTTLVIDHSDGENGNYASYFIKKRLVRNVNNEFFKGGLLETVEYYNLDNNDCLTIIMFSKKGNLKFEYHLIRIGEHIYEELIKGEKEKFISNIEKSKETILNAH